MSTCPSTYTINRHTGEKITCELEKHDQIKLWGRDHTRHAAHYAGIEWFWTGDEQDNSAA